MKSIVFSFLLISIGGFGFSAADVNGSRWQQSVSTSQPRTKIVILGTGTPNADPDRSGPSVAIIVDDTPYIVDFGPGVVRRAAAAFRNGVKGLEVKNLKTAFVTHLHSDHTLGFADLIFTPWVLERKEPLDVYGPVGLRSMAKHLEAAYKEDIAIRLYGGEPSNKTGYRVQAHEIRPGIVYKDSNVTVKAFLVKHGTFKQAFGYRFETPDRTIVVSGDCVPSESVVEACNGCDVLIHEVYSAVSFAARPPEWQRYHSRFHTSTKQLAELATRAKPKLLILYHQLFWGRTDQQLVDEVSEGFKGKIVSARDLDVY
jgi:ribonuclease BN (tRNA processing enzyme)